MNSDDFKPMREDGIGAVRRRHVVYVEGYDPRGPEGYFELFRESCNRFRRIWPISLTLEPLKIDSDDLAHWSLHMHGGNWQTATHYDFLRLERFIQSDMARPALSNVLRALAWYVGDNLSGAQFRIACGAWRFSLYLLYFQLLVIVWVAIAAIVAVAAYRATVDYLGWPEAAAIVISLVAAGVAFIALHPVAKKLRAFQLVCCWSVLRRFGRGRPTWFDHAIDVGARRILAVAQTAEADELAIVGHSAGCVIAAAIVARALELDPDLGRHGPRLVLLTLGSVMPGVALHPLARRMRNIVRQLAIAPRLTWVDCQSRKDVMGFTNFDPVDGVGLHVGAQRCNPLLWQINFRQLIAPETYNRFRWNYFRVHYQYIMSGHRPAPYDYILLVAGPAPIADWPKHHLALMAAFTGHATPGSQPSRHDLVAGSDAI
jgi:hypothetical protein